MMLKKLCFLLICIFFFQHSKAQESELLLDKPYSSAVFLMTHNAYNNAFEGFLFPNQNNPVAIQLTDGVRGLMLDVYLNDSSVYCYHSLSQLGHKLLLDILHEIKIFMDGDTTAIITIQFENYVDNEDLLKVFDQAGLTSYTHIQPEDQHWPALRQMISANKRLVVFCEFKRGTAMPWIHYMWNYDSETHYQSYSRTDFDFDIGRGDPTSDLFTMNHFITAQGLGFGIEDSAAAINSYDFLFNRGVQCFQSLGKIPNFIAVDFYDQGETMRAVNELNALRLGVDEESAAVMEIFPNPCREIFYAKLKKDFRYHVNILDMKGQVVRYYTLEPGNELYRIHVEGLPEGLYFGRFSCAAGVHSAKIMIN